MTDKERQLAQQLDVKRPGQLQRRDRLVDRCPICGAWRWRQHCHICDERESEE